MSYDIDEIVQRMGIPRSRGRPTVNEERNRIAVELHKRGYSYRQIGEVLGISGQAVSLIVRRHTSLT